MSKVEFNIEFDTDDLKPLFGLDPETELIALYLQMALYWTTQALLQDGAPPKKIRKILQGMNQASEPGISDSIIGSLIDDFENSKPSQVKIMSFWDHFYLEFWVRVARPLCWVGLHDWWMGGPGWPPVWVSCLRCGRTAPARGKIWRDTRGN